MTAVVLDAPRQVLEFTRPSTVTPQQARQWVRRILGGHGVTGEAVDRAAVVTSELVTNACVHGPSDSPVVVTVRQVAAGIEVAVHDQGRIAPGAWADAGAVDAERGRGLTIVRAMCLFFDVEMHRFGGKTVTAVIA